MPLIELNKVVKVFATEGTETVALAGVTLSIDKGEFVAIMGPSGSGKSTLLHILGLLDRQTNGTYLFEGRETDAFKEDELATLRNQRIGFVFQAFNLLPRTSVIENVVLPLAYSRTPQKEWYANALRAIDSVGLSHRTHHEPSQLSGGEKQRSAIARALVTEPAILFADEPTGNLDSASGAQVMEILERLNKKEGKTIVLITHDITLGRHADRIIGLYDGKIDYNGPSGDYEQRKKLK